MKMLENDGKILRYAAVMVRHTLQLYSCVFFITSLFFGNFRTPLTLLIKTEGSLLCSGCPMTQSAYMNHPKGTAYNNNQSIGGSYSLLYTCTCSTALTTLYMTQLFFSHRNSGIKGGQFLERSRISKPHSSKDNPDYYKPQDFAMGATVECFKHKFVITDADKYVLTYMMDRKDEFPAETIEALAKKHNQ